MIRRLWFAVFALLVLAASAAPSQAADAPAPAGTWDGLLDIPFSMRIVVEIKPGAAGAYTAVMRSPDQSGVPIPSAIRVDGRHVVVDSPAVDARFDGTLAVDGGSMGMSFTQGAATVPVVLTRRAEGAAVPPRVPRALRAAPVDADILAVLKSRIDAGRGVGIVVGVIDGQGHRRIVAYGASDHPDGKPVNGDTLFEIGSITKTFTSLLLTDAVRRGEVQLDDPLAKYLPSNIKVPSRSERQITLIDLATHTSGLPRMPGNFAPANAANPYADYSPDRLYAFLDGYQLPRDIGARWEYSNYGVALLGQALARRAGLDYPTMLHRRVLEPLGMTSTAIVLGGPLKARFATGHDAEQDPVSQWDLTGFAPAGGIRSSANDMLTLLAAEIGAKPSPLAGAMDDQLKVRRPNADLDSAQALGWAVDTYANGEIATHDGATGGFQSAVAFDKARKIAVVVLSNSAGVGMSDIAEYALGGAHPATLQPLPPKAATRKVIGVDSASLAAYVGAYRLAPTISLQLSVEGGRLYVQATGQEKRELNPVGVDTFVDAKIDVTVVFRRNLDGYLGGLVLYQEGSRRFAPRIG
jgi:D-alanyl-D-alanine-carboxypeptidase/D-alanyl-D-alanine-endopeptidase